MRRFIHPCHLLLVLSAVAVLVSAPAGADTFRAILGGRVLGTLDYAGGGGGTGALRTVLDNTPLGVGDGQFDGRTEWVQADGRSLLQYTGDSASSRKSRQISVLLEDGRVIQTAVNPASERTPLSVAEKVPEGVIDPVTAFGRMIGAGECPPAFVIYDGRRVVQVKPRSAEVAGARKTCRMTYDVVAGPGHLSPFRFTALKLDLVYEAGQLAQMQIGAGPFSLRLTR